MTRNNSDILELNLFPFSNPDLNHQPPPQQLTIFYNGNVCVTDVTELQAKAILLLAIREKQEKLIDSPSGSSSPSELIPESPLKQSSSSLSSPICNPNGLSMKKSLQRFLQKRNNRIQSTFPYNISRPLKSHLLRRH